MFSVTLALGVFVVVAILLSPFYAARVRLAGPVRRSATRLGAALVLGSLGLAALAASLPHGRRPATDALFAALFALLLVGALLILCGGDPGDERGDDTDGDP